MYCLCSILTMKSKRENGEIFFEVSDSGVRILDEEVLNLFKPFLREEVESHGAKAGLCKMSRRGILLNDQCLIE